MLLRTVNPSTGAHPFQSLMVADLGDVNINLYNLQDSCRLIREAYQKIVAADCIPLTLGNGIRKGKGRSLPSGFSNAGPEYSCFSRAGHSDCGDRRIENIINSCILTPGERIFKCRTRMTDRDGLE